MARDVMVQLRAMVLALLVIVVVAVTPAVAFPVWGNDQIADCTFAAAANWEVLALRYTPSESRVEREFLLAHGNPEVGIEQEPFEVWWRRHGIGGVRVRLTEVPGEVAAMAAGEVLPVSAVLRLQEWLMAYRLLIGQLGNHEVVLNGYDALGPLIVSYGEEQQITWREWREEAWGAWRGAVV